MIKELQTKDIQEFIRKNPNSILIDVRTNYEWENIGKTLTRDEKTLSKPFNIENLKTKQEITPLQDSVMIDQKDIEELDGNDLNLTPLF